MSIKFANNAFGTLNAGISSSDTSITLSSGQGARFPVLASGEYFYITLIDTSNNLEVVKCTARSTDVLTVTRAQDNTTARAFVIGDRVELRVTAAALEDSSNPYDKDTSSTGSFALPVGTTAQQPAAADTEGHIRYDSDDNIIYFSDGTGWFKIAAVTAQLTGVSGNIFAGAASTLTLTGSGFLTANLVVNFTQSSDSIDEDITVTPISDTSATVTTTSAIYSNVTSGNTVTIQVTNSDGLSSGTQTVTAKTLPSGGSVTTSSGYRIHSFTSSGTLTVPTGLTLSNVEYVIVAGGAGGGAPGGGGGGAGGYRSSVSGESSGGGASAESQMTLSAGSYSVTVGGGGAGGVYSVTPGAAGGTSTFNSVSATGGGGGGQNSHPNASSGGSGGGGGANGSGGSGTSGQGYAGGSSANDTYGGGGGAAAAGVNASSSNGFGNGGNGVASSITGSSVTRAGGGGGGCSTSSPIYTGATICGTGGSGGGGYGTQGTPTPQAGTANTGGGGGGRGNGNNAGANGGSGIVIVRYQL